MHEKEKKEKKRVTWEPQPPIAYTYIIGSRRVSLDTPGHLRLNEEVSPTDLTLGTSSGSYTRREIPRTRYFFPE